MFDTGYWVNYHLARVNWSFIFTFTFSPTSKIGGGVGVGCTGKDCVWAQLPLDSVGQMHSLWGQVQNANTGLLVQKSIKYFKTARTEYSLKSRALLITDLWQHIFLAWRLAPAPQSTNCECSEDFLKNYYIRKMTRDCLQAAGKFLFLQIFEENKQSKIKE